MNLIYYSFSKKHKRDIMVIFILFALCHSAFAQQQIIKDVFNPLPANAIHLIGFFENDIQHSINNWNKGVVPYERLVNIFRGEKTQFAQGEMWGKSVRSGCMFYCMIDQN